MGSDGGPGMPEVMVLPQGGVGRPKLARQSFGLEVAANVQIVAESERASQVSTLS